MRGRSDPLGAHGDGAVEARSPAPRTRVLAVLSAVDKMGGEVDEWSRHRMAWSGVQIGTGTRISRKGRGPRLRRPEARQPDM